MPESGKSKLKVAFLHQPNVTISLSNLNSSVEIITHELATGLAKYCDVIVYARRGSHEKEFEYYEGVQYRRISTWLDEKLEYLAQGIENRLLKSHNSRRPFFASKLYYMTYGLRVARDLKSEKCDIVHIHNFSQFIPIIRALNPDIKIVLHMHCDWLTQLDQTMIEDRLEAADLIVGVSNFITNRIIHRFPQFASRCETLYNGVDTERFVNDGRRSKEGGDSDKRLLFVGRVSPEKGVHVLIEAFQTVLKQDPNVQLTLVGQHFQLPPALLIALSRDPKEMALKRFYRCNYLSYLDGLLSRNEKCKVSFVGTVQHKYLPNYYNNADICIVPSVCHEPCVVPVLESMSMGIPIVATKSGGSPELVVNGETGLLVERDDAPEMAKAILRLLSDEKMRKSIGRAARKRALEFFSWERIVERLFNQYKSICEENT